jgi:hypothetical protein
MGNDDHTYKHKCHTQNNDTPFFFNFYITHKMVAKYSLTIEVAFSLDVVSTITSK